MTSKKKEDTIGNYMSTILNLKKSHSKDSVKYRSNGGSTENLDPGSPLLKALRSPPAIRSAIDKSAISGPSNFSHVLHAESTTEATKILNAQAPIERIKTVLSPSKSFPEEKKLDSSMISSPTQFSHLQHVETSKGLQELFSDQPTGIRSFLSKKFSNLLSIQTRTARQKALAIELQGLNKPEKNALRKEFLLRESRVALEKRKRMSINDFDMVQVLGHGGFGVVRLVKERATGEIYAIKSLAKLATLEKNQGDHVKAERRILSIASEIGDWIVRLFYSFQDQDFLHFVLEYMPGGDLLGLLIKKDIFEEPFAQFYFAEIVMAIEEVHKLGMIHRDIKPDNFLFDTNGHLKLADFGLATDTRQAESPIEMSTQHGEPLKDRRHQAYSIVGTNNYVAPEVLRGGGYDKSCDWWSAGIILFEMLFGYPPFSSSSPSITREKIRNWEMYLRKPDTPQCSSSAWDLILKLLCESENRLGKQELPIAPTETEALIHRMLDDGDANDIKNHTWFLGFDWEDLKNQTPPFVPQLADATDTSNFDEIDAERVNYLLEVTHSATDSYKESSAFEGFTYTGSNPLTNAIKDC